MRSREEDFFKRLRSFLSRGEKRWKVEKQEEIIFPMLNGNELINTTV